MTSGVFYRSFNQYAGRTVIERTANKVIGQPEIELVVALAVGFPCTGGNVKCCQINGRSFDSDFGIIYRLAKEVIGPHGAGYVISRAITMLRLRFISGE